MVLFSLAPALLSPLVAYVGPGLGAGALAAVAGFLFSMFLALFTVIYYPIKRLLRSWRPKQAPSVDASDESAA